MLVIREIFKIVSLLTWCLLVTPGYASFRDRIRVESHKIFIKYKQEIEGKHSGFHQAFDVSEFHNTEPSDCSTAYEFCLKWKDLAQFKITTDNNCEDFEFRTTLDTKLKVTFDISNVHLYGGPEQDFQKWPMDYDEYEEYSFVSRDVFTKGVLEPYWLVSSGFYLYVHESTPLFITQRKSKGIFELIAERKAPYTRSRETILKYKVCKFDDMKQAHKHAIANIFGKPTDIPDKRMVQYPIWSTWAKYKAKINHTVIMEFANLIKNNKLPNSQLELDDKWEICYGSLEIDKNRFPDMKGLVQQLNTMGFRVTVWVHPFINEDCEPYHSQAKQLGYLVKNSTGATVVDWWNGRGSVVDFTNPEAAKWWSDKLRKIKTETGIDSYKFDAGESGYSPQVPIYHRTADDHPETHLKDYVKTVSKFGNMVEVRSSRGTQTYPIFVRMMDRDTNWDGRLGLQTLIPTLLQMNIIGYPFVLPDMIGGNGYFDGEVVTKEMFIRWLQINVFMPALQFSFPPWDYGEDVLTITQKYVDLHAKYSNKIIEAMINAKQTGTPVNPPIWWIDPTDPVAQNIGSEFLLGEDILVAPVIEPGVRSRDIYLPKGIWLDEVKKGEPITGPVWLYNYPADIDTLPYFTKIKDTDEDKSGAISLHMSTGLSICVIALVTFYRHL